MDNTATLIRFVGVLREDHTFIHVPAWETAWVFERPIAGDGTYVVDLLDGDGEVVTRVSPEIEFRPPEDPLGAGLYLADVLTYAAMRPSVRTLVFRRLTPNVVEIFRADVAATPPVIEELVVDGGDTSDFQLKWTTRHDRPVTSTLFYWPDQRRPLLLTSGLRENAFAVAPSRLPGPKGRFAVCASDGLRAGVAVSRTVEGLSTAIRIRIVTPVAGSVLPADQPVDAIARVEDVSGAASAASDVEWRVDGRAVGRGTMTTIALEPGDHELEATSLPDAGPIAGDVVRLTVAERNEAQRAFAERVADLPPLAARRLETEL